LAAAAPARKGESRLTGTGAGKADMLLHRVRLFSLFGFEVLVDASWLLLAALIVWSLAAAIFPELAPNLDPVTYWSMAVIATIGLMVSIVFHEMSHSLVARHYGIEIRGITLFIFGGVAEMKGEPKSAHAEFLMALAGPVASFILAAALLASFAAAKQMQVSAAFTGVLWYLGFLNGMLALFNLVPAFPLDGGRMLRAALWGWRRDFAWATRIAARSGNVFGILLIVLGVYSIIRGDFVGGMWRCLIGMFLRGAAGASYQQLLAQRVFEGVTVAQVMTPNPIAVPPNVSVAAFIEDYVYGHHHREFPVAHNGRLMGIVGTRQAIALDRSRWPSTPVAEVMVPCTADDIIEPGARALDALTRMTGASRRRLYVVEDGRLVGILSSRDLMELLSLKLELSQERK